MSLLRLGYKKTMASVLGVSLHPIFFFAYTERGQLQCFKLPYGEATWQRIKEGSGSKPLSN